MLLHIRPDRSCTPSAFPLFRSLIKVGAAGQAELHGPHVSLTPDQAPVLLAAAQVPTLQRGGLEVTALKYSSLGAINSS
ncbi:hypothetical protein CesoFtcFv8_005277 [Champsocephalus esox]|uniref:Uncharacterized protein n=1 Tax=Champsocephalus esox TaxID=159716 RepID=A0AAN8CRV7_9TELE|nr:hypothetical protein CesoFtcFv8_005277 [Champsocephalus esox]